MTTVRQMLPAAAQPFTEVIVGAGLGALLSKFLLRDSMTTGAIVGGVAGYGIALTKARGAFPFTVVSGAAKTSGFYAGEEVIEQQLPAVDAYGQQAATPPAIIEEVIPNYRPFRRDDWWRRGGAYGRGGWGHGWRR
jgi:hypothetical protein